MLFASCMDDVMLTRPASPLYVKPLMEISLVLTAGNPKAPMYYRNANCAVVVYDITQSTSLEKAKSWIRELQRQADPNIVIALCGNKLDLAARRQVSQEEAKKYADEEGLMWGETSAKSGEGVADIFTSIGMFYASASQGSSDSTLNDYLAERLPLTAPPSARGGTRPGAPGARTGVDLNKQAITGQGQGDQCNC